MTKINVTKLLGNQFDGNAGTFEIVGVDFNARMILAMENHYENDDIPWEVTSQTETSFTDRDMRNLLHDATGKNYTLVWDKEQV